MPRTLDVRCPTCETTEDDVVLGQEEPIPGCPDCGGGRVISWAAGKAPGAKLYQPVYDDVNGRYMDEDEWKRHRVAVAHAQAVPVEQIVAHRQSKAEATTHGEEMKHRASVRRQKQGISADVLKDVKETVRATGTNPLNGRKAKTRRAP